MTDRNRLMDTRQRQPGSLSGLYGPIDAYTQGVNKLIDKAIAGSGTQWPARPGMALSLPNAGAAASMLLTGGPELLSSGLKAVSAPLDLLRSSNHTKYDVDLGWGDALNIGLAGVGGRMFRGKRADKATNEQAAYQSDVLPDIRAGRQPEIAASEYPYSAPPVSQTGVSLSKNIGDGNDFHYVLYRDGKHIGETNGTVSGDKAFIDWIGDGPTRGANSIGISGVKSLREQMRRDYPDVKIFEGHRVTGSRADGNGDTVQRVYMPSVAAGSGAGLNSLMQYYQGGEPQY